ncbi:FecR family protein [Sphingobacterium sp. MYb388]|uniref:FecR family protein n=1 Tax=Sphingobacterium sp. MYb388 TaxID=2745437 RepID=UPI00309D88DC
MKNKRIEYLAHKWLNNTISSEEGLEFNQWYREGLENPVFIHGKYAKTEEELRDRIYQVIDRNIHKKRRSGRWLRTVAAAFVVLNICAGIYLYSNNDQELVITNSSTQDLPPGTDQATLTLSDGRRVQLSDVGHNDQLADQGGVVISKTADGQLIYHVSTSAKADPKGVVSYHTIETPQGGQYQVVLPDGTHVWLNAASSFRYPTSFPKTGRREVQLSYGEAYFEVSPDTEQPFIVSSGRQQLEVLGTHFNVSAYTEDATVKTTLLEGKVKLTDRLSKEEVMLRAGQQAQLSGTGIQVKTLDEANMDLWKDGKFTFNNERMLSVMQQIARWYKIKVVFQDPVQDVRLNGSVSRFEHLSTLLSKLEQTGLVSFRREGDNLVIMKP